MIELDKASEEKRNKRIDARWEALSYNERAKALYLLDLYKEMGIEDEVNNIFKYQK